MGDHREFAGSLTRYACCIRHRVLTGVARVMVINQSSPCVGTMVRSHGRYAYQGMLKILTTTNADNFSEIKACR